VSFRNLYEASVFKRMPRETTPSEALVTFFHRAAATKYLIIALWGVMAAFFGINTFVIIWDRPIQIVYSLVVAVMASLACVGATFYPRFMKLELFAGSGTLVLLVFYTLAVAYRFFFLHDPLVAAFTVLALGILILPGCRTVFIFRWGTR
jgi:hypothetical protein